MLFETSNVSLIRKIIINYCVVVTGSPWSKIIFSAWVKFKNWRKRKPNPPRELRDSSWTEQDGSVTYNYIRYRKRTSCHTLKHTPATEVDKQWQIFCRNTRWPDVTHPTTRYSPFIKITLLFIKTRPSSRKIWWAFIYLLTPLFLC